eukprot:TRINITY_DN91751_c0_g1_i1.p1 TRINITY_DN91751_c0_g1~~TRINITY_DN91751_c0_g1_i1.p1  ORF type:complete len:201 (+),score=34.56 TRINITY_DN91751_c0_g1_i1:93-695(+)
MPWLKLVKIVKKEFDGLSDDDEVPLVDLGHGKGLAENAYPRTAVDRSELLNEKNMAQAVSWRPSSHSPIGPFVMNSEAGAVRETPWYEVSASPAPLPCMGAPRGCENMQNARMSAASTSSMTKAEKQKLLHDHGRCRPCQFHVQKADGCRCGLDCDFCHLCDRPQYQAMQRKLKKGLGSHRVSLRGEGGNDVAQQLSPAA